MLGFRFTNLLIPGDPAQFTIQGAHGDWAFEQQINFPEFRNAVQNEHRCAETYVAEHPVTGADGAVAVEGTMGELLPLCLGASFLTGQSVTVKRSTPHSEVMIAQVRSRFPRERSLNGAQPCVNDQQEFKETLEAFLVAYQGAGQEERISLAVHHLLDSLACWSLEDLYLSATTILQVIAANEKRKAAAYNSGFFTNLAAAAVRFHIPRLSHDIVRIRNDLIHDGTISGTRFVGKSAAECKAVAADALNWIDAYFHVALSLGQVRRIRFNAASFDRLNVYSL
jgi:hypothetical protein